MLWYLFALVMAVSIGLIVLGTREKAQQTDLLFKLTGFMILFLLGVSLMGSGIEYISGTNVTAVNYISENITGEVTVNIISSFEGLNLRLTGFFISILGAIGFMLTFFDLRKDYIRGQD